MSHTPGPWVVKHIAGQNFAVQTFSIRGVFNGKPGIAPIFNKDRHAIDGALINVSPQDAALIGAAPELLAALRHVLVTNEISESDYPEGWTAIAKATGAAQ